MVEEVDFQTPNVERRALGGFAVPAESQPDSCQQALCAARPRDVVVSARVEQRHFERFVRLRHGDQRDVVTAQL
jgi:hypothetical protein